MKASVSHSFNYSFWSELRSISLDLKVQSLGWLICLRLFLSRAEPGSVVGMYYSIKPQLRHSVPLYILDKADATEEGKEGLVGVTLRKAALRQFLYLVFQNERKLHRQPRRA